MVKHGNSKSMTFQFKFKVEIKLELSLTEIRRNAESVCPRSNFIMLLDVVLILKFLLKLRFPTDACRYSYEKQCASVYLLRTLLV